MLPLRLRVVPRQLDAPVLDVVDRADGLPVGADDFHVLADFLGIHAIPFWLPRGRAPRIRKPVQAGFHAASRDIYLRVHSRQGVKDVFKKLCIAVLGALAASGAHAVDKKWSRLDGCRYLEHKNNDGDSFHVQCGKEKFFARFYFVDAPEAYANVAAQLQEQYEYFGVTMDEATRAGAKARDRVHSLLASRPFVVHTRRASGQGRSGNIRYLSLVEVDGRYLHEVLLSEGLARAKGTPVTLPTGQKSKDYVPALRRLEDEARIGRRGLWGTSIASKRTIKNSPL